MFKGVSTKLELVGIEKEILDFWRSQQIRQKSISQRAGGPDFVFYEGPPTANGKPGVHHVLARAFKDLFPRYKAMRGFHVIRRGGWDTHGLPVEIQVEKRLGITNKRQIEAYGISLCNRQVAYRERIITISRVLTRTPNFRTTTSSVVDNHVCMVIAHAIIVHAIYADVCSNRSR